ncbi:hypothetical protein [Phreatobacter stygius]|uniref:hypothetical protein n=1 Tax=Phreatobacter stygius TaxID=1940610 RepID=UPI0014778220|nr:hypothetical protein [Phreatobacter stygius]
MTFNSANMTRGHRVETLASIDAQLAVIRAEAASTLFLVVAVLATGLVAGSLILWRSLV